MCANKAIPQLVNLRSTTMSKNTIFSWIVTIFGALCAGLLLTSYFFPNNSYWVEASILGALTLVALFFWNALQKVPAGPPPNKAVLLLRGRRQDVVLEEGWNVFPLYPFLFDFILVNVETQNLEVKNLQVRTPDKAIVKMEAEITYDPGIEGNPHSYNVYLNRGGAKGVEKILGGIVGDRTKTWASSNREGPSTWIEAQQLRDDIHGVLVKSLLGAALTDVDSPIPTGTWMRFFDSPQSQPTVYDSAERPHQPRWAFRDEETGEWNWDGLQAIFNGYTPEEQEALKGKIKDRRDAIREIREGSGKFPLESLGITILKFTVGELEVGGNVAAMADNEEKERRQREGEDMELDGVSERVARLRKKHPEYTIQEATRVVQLQQGKLTQQIVEVIGAATGLGQDVIAGASLHRTPAPQPASPPSNPGNNPAGNPQGGAPQPNKDPAQAAQEFFDQHGNWPYWDPMNRGGGKNP